MAAEREMAKSAPPRVGPIVRGTSQELRLRERGRQLRFRHDTGGTRRVCQAEGDEADPLDRRHHEKLHRREPPADQRDRDTGESERAEPIATTMTVRRFQRSISAPAGRPNRR
jgi:hypothetical protein